MFRVRFAIVTLTRGGVSDLLRAGGDRERLPGDLDLLPAGDRDDLFAPGDLDRLQFFQCMRMENEVQVGRSGLSKLDGHVCWAEFRRCVGTYLA
jgi:hypothetical protein